MDGCRNKGLAPPERGPVEPPEQPFFAAEDQILGLDLNNIPARVAAHALGTDNQDHAEPAILAQRNTSREGKGGPISLAKRNLPRSAPPNTGQRDRKSDVEGKSVAVRADYGG